MFKSFSTSSFGCPNLLFSPTPISANSGFTTFIKSSVEEVLEPWCPTFKTFELNKPYPGNILKVYQINKILKVLKEWRLL